MANRLRLQRWATNRKGWFYSVNLDGVPLGCLHKDHNDLSLAKAIQSHVVGLLHHRADDGIMMFEKLSGLTARRVAVLVLRDYESSKITKAGIRFDDAEAVALLKLANYLMRSDVGPHQKTILMIKSKVQPSDRP